MKVARLVVSFALFWGIAHQSFARDIYETFDLLKDLPENFTVFGSVCEEVAKLDLKEMYPESEYYTRVGINYESNGRVAGELDTIVFRNDTGEAVIIGEVKCWKNMNKAIKKAHEQLSRFDRHMDGNKIDSMYEVDDQSQVYQTTQFDEDPRQMTIGQKGATAHGFTMELDLSLQELHRLHEMLVACKKQHQCDARALN
jgi:hypothetical protein